MIEGFTFCICCYNQESYIRETLDSILYQKKKHGGKIDVDMLVLDDHSNDHTFEVVKNWVRIYRNYFKNIKTYRNRVNKGTVYNYQFLLKQVQTQAFKVLAGDDVCGGGNLFRQFSDLKSNQIKSYIRMDFIDGKVTCNVKNLELYFYNKYFVKGRKDQLKAFRSGGYFHTPSTIHLLDLYKKAKCEKFQSEFVLFEDDPAWYCMLKNEAEVQVRFMDECIVLYRMHDQSVSQGNKQSSQIFAKELKRLKAAYIKDASGFEKIRYQCFISNLPKYVRVDKYYDHVKRYIIHLKVHKNPKFLALCKKAGDMQDREQRYYDQYIKIRKDT